MCEASPVHGIVQRYLAPLGARLSHAAQVLFCRLVCVAVGLQQVHVVHSRLWPIFDIRRLSIQPLIDRWDVRLDVIEERSNLLGGLLLEVIASSHVATNGPPLHYGYEKPQIFRYLLRVHSDPLTRQTHQSGGNVPIAGLHGCENPHRRGIGVDHRQGDAVICCGPFVLNLAVASPEGLLDVHVKEGDIVLQQSRSAQSAALQAATGSPYTHVGLAFIRNGSFQVIEAVQPVRWTGLSEWVARGRDGHVVVVRAKGGLSSEKLHELRRSAEGYLGRDYDPHFQWDDGRIYCSELVYKAYAAIDREIGDLVPLSTFNLTSDVVQQLIRERARNSLDESELVVAPASMLDHMGFEVVYTTDPSIEENAIGPLPK